MQPVACTSCGAPTRQTTSSLEALCDVCYSKRSLGEPYLVEYNPELAPFTQDLTHFCAAEHATTRDPGWRCATCKKSVPLTLAPLPAQPEDSLPPVFPPPEPG